MLYSCSMVIRCAHMVILSECGMGLGGVEASTAGRNEVWRRGVEGGRYSALPKLVTQKLRLDRERALVV